MNMHYFSPAAARVLRSTIALWLMSCLAASAAERQARYVFLMIGDGMGAAPRALAEACLPYVATQGAHASTRLAMNTLPVSGLSRTASLSEPGATDSAAAGTAIACGRKTKNGMLAVGPDGVTPYATLAEISKQRGMKVGIVTSVSIDHATPAAFYAHVGSRSSVYGIAMALAASDFDYFGGGPAVGAGESSRKNRENETLHPCPIEAARANGFTVLSNRAGLAACVPPAGKVWAFAETTDQNSALPYAIDRAAGDLTLADFTRKGIELLTNPAGFFMMIEGGKIDWAGHDNDAATNVRETLDFDESVAEVLEFYRAHPDETLVIVTADHDTGGLVLPANLPAAGLAALLGQKGSSYTYHPWMAAARKEGWSPERLLEGVIERFGFVDLSDAERAELAEAAKLSLMPPAEQEKNPEPFKAYGGRDPAWTVAIRLQTARTGLSWTTGGHTAQDVPTTAIGVGAEALAGTLDNTEIFPRILAAMGVASDDAAGAAGR